MAPPPLDAGMPPTKESDMQSHQQKTEVSTGELMTQFPNHHSGSWHLSLTILRRVFGTYPQSRQLPAPKRPMGTRVKLTICNANQEEGKGLQWHNAGRVLDENHLILQ